MSPSLDLIALNKRLELKFPMVRLVPILETPMLLLLLYSFLLS